MRDPMLKLELHTIGWVLLRHLLLIVPDLLQVLLLLFQILPGLEPVRSRIHLVVRKYLPINSSLLFSELLIVFESLL